MVRELPGLDERVEVASNGITDLVVSESAPPAGKSAGRMVAVAEDLARIAADIDAMYRSGEQASNPIALYDALHAVHRALVALDFASPEDLERVVPPGMSAVA